MCCGKSGVCAAGMVKIRGGFFQFVVASYRMYRFECVGFYYVDGYELISEVGV